MRLPWAVVRRSSYLRARRRRVLEQADELVTAKGQVLLDLCAWCGGQWDKSHRAGHCPADQLVKVEPKRQFPTSAVQAVRIKR